MIRAPEQTHERDAMQATRMPSSRPPSWTSRFFTGGPVTCIEDLRVLAERRVPRMFYDYADSGSYTEGTYRANEDDFSRIKLRQRVAVDMTNRSLASTMAGQPVSMPVALASPACSTPTARSWRHGPPPRPACRSRSRP
jgi:L-lactate dehydrogenase (cytochrome)